MQPWSCDKSSAVIHQAHTSENIFEAQIDTESQPYDGYKRILDYTIYLGRSFVGDSNIRLEWIVCQQICTINI